MKVKFLNVGISNQCQPSDSSQCKKTYQMTCEEVDNQFSFSKCSKKYLTNGGGTLTFDPYFDFCSGIYMNVNNSLCTKTEDSDICTVDLRENMQNNPDCFNRYSMIIEYTCEGIAVGVSIGCGIVASIVIITICFKRRSDQHKKGSSINQQNNYIGNQCVALPQRPQEKSDKIELIGDITNNQHYHDSTTPSNLTNEEYTYIDSINNRSSGASNSENYVVLDPNETGFNRQGNPTVQNKQVLYNPETNANENRLGNDKNNHKASPYEMKTEIQQVKVCT
ncbi:unnamed protein product [Mytilus coruscus]|uniref:Uncharacterized protein n=1 Tax=Mytilus coruscus TaxID=42192 RepID=A0A6J8EVQ9_MYTCO|nr:unnamed protein product [Mytilus coruscus]